MASEISLFKKKKKALGKKILSWWKIFVLFFPTEVEEIIIHPVTLLRA